MLKCSQNTLSYTPNFQNMVGPQNDLSQTPRPYGAFPFITAWDVFLGGGARAL